METKQRTRGMKGAFLTASAMLAATAMDSIYNLGSPQSYEPSPMSKRTQPLPIGCNRYFFYDSTDLYKVVVEFPARTDQSAIRKFNNWLSTQPTKQQYCYTKGQQYGHFNTGSQVVMEAIPITTPS